MTLAKVKPTISPELLNQIDIRVGTIESVSDVSNSEKLVALRVNFGDHWRTVLAGMKREQANPREIEGKQALFVVNLPLRKNGGTGVRGDAVGHRLCGRHYPCAGRTGVESA